MKCSIVFATFFCGIAFCCRAADDSFPDGMTGYEAVDAAGKPERIMESPSGKYNLITRCRSEFTGPLEYRRCDAGLDTVLHFRDKSKPDAKLPVVDFPDHFLQQSRYFFSPDERWIIRDQHVGAGTNHLTLYEINPNGKINSVDIYNLVFDFVFNHSRCSENKYGHMMVHFESWDLASGSIHLNVDAQTLDEHACPQIDREVVYDLKKRRIGQNT
jgi:hypothetical protein